MNRAESKKSSGGRGKRLCVKPPYLPGSSVSTYIVSPAQYTVLCSQFTRECSPPSRVSTSLRSLGSFQVGYLRADGRTLDGRR